MKRLWTILIIAVLVTATMPALAQKIETETSDHNQILHLKTALNHLTVIELREPVIQVATGSQSFKVEWRENRVFVQPTEPDASTNLFIWTASQRLNYELEPAGAVTTMDFAVDQTPIQVIQPKPTTVPPPPQPSPTEVLLAGRPVRMESAKPGKKRVEVVIHDLYEGDGRVLVRYAIRNQGDQAYTVYTPSVYVLTGARYSRSLYSLANSQLGDQEAHLTNEGRTRVPVLDSRVQSSRIEPGHEAVGVVAVSLPTTTEPTVLRFEFSNDERGPVTAVLVR